MIPSLLTLAFLGAAALTALTAPAPRPIVMMDLWISEPRRDTLAYSDFKMPRCDVTPTIRGEFFGDSSPSGGE